MVFFGFFLVCFWFFWFCLMFCSFPYCLGSVFVWVFRFAMGSFVSLVLVRFCLLCCSMPHCFFFLVVFGFAIGFPVFFVCVSVRVWVPLCVFRAAVCLWRWTRFLDSIFGVEIYIVFLYIFCSFLEFSDSHCFFRICLKAPRRPGPVSRPETRTREAAGSRESRKTLEF